MNIKRSEIKNEAELHNMHYATKLRKSSQSASSALEIIKNCPDRQVHVAMQSGVMGPL